MNWLEVGALRLLGRDGRLLFATRAVRMFAFGGMSVVLALYLSALGFDGLQIGWLLSLTLTGDAIISLYISSVADRVGRAKMLMLGAGLMILSGVVFALSGNFWWLLAAAIIGTISPSANEVGPFLALEQSAISQNLPAGSRTAVFAWYNLAGSFATALGALGAGLLVQALQQTGSSAVQSHQIVIALYGALGGLLLVMFTRLSPSIEVNAPAPSSQNALGLGESKGVILRLSSLIALDGFGSGLVVQSLIVLWFERKFGVQPVLLGAIFFGANILAGFSALAASRVAARFGLINTMVFTHIPSNILLMLVPLMPNLGWAIAVLLARFSISQMDVPTRQSYVMSVVQPSERSAAAGVTGIARTIGSSLAPLLAGALGFGSAPFFLAGGLKIVYDLALYRSFIAVKPPEER